MAPQPRTVNRAIAFDGPGRPLRVVEQELAGLDHEQARVRVELAGICGSDAHRLAGDLPPPTTPVTFGHEGIGTVEEMGAGFDADSMGVPLAVGDRVLWSAMSACGRCDACARRQEPAQCARQVWPVPVDQASRAGYQEVATLDRTTVCARVPEGVAAEAVIAFGCAMPTALGGMRRLGAVLPGSTVVIQGSGPVGLAFAVLLGRSAAARVIVVGAPSGRLEVAGRLGATDIIDIAFLSPDERRARVLDLTRGRGADVVVEAAGALPAFAEGLDLLAPSGRYLIAGLYAGAGTVAVDPVRLNNRTQTIIGSLGYRPEDVAGTVALAVQLGETLDFAGLVTSRYPLENTEVGIREMGAAIKGVIEP